MIAAAGLAAAEQQPLALQMKEVSVQQEKFAQEDFAFLHAAAQCLFHLIQAP